MRHLYSFYSDAFWIALQSIIQHKLRAFLTLIGIIIGVAAVVVVGASISGLNSYVTEKVSKVLGVNHFMMSRMAFSGQMSEEEFERQNRRNKKITFEEYEYVKEHCAGCAEVGAEMNASADLKENALELPATRILGVTSNMADIEDKTIESGRFISPDEVTRSAKVCVIGYDVKDKFFPDRDPVGQVLRVKGVPLQIVGLEEKKGSMFGQSMDRQVYIPLTLHMLIFNRSDGLQVHGKSSNREDFMGAIDEARTVLRNKRQLLGSTDDTFGVVNTQDLGNQIDQFTAAIAAVVVPITLITLIVGGLIGLLLAVGVTQLITWLAEITMTITITYVILSVGVSSFIGIVAGLYPAYKAAKLDPIVALTQN